MREEIENYEENEKPIWNKNAIWNKIEGTIEPNTTRVLLFPWIKFVAACGLLLIGMGWIIHQNSTQYSGISVLNEHSNTIQYITKFDTVYKIKTVQHHSIVKQYEIVRDTILALQPSVLVRDTVLVTKEIYVENRTSNDSSKTQKNKIANANTLNYVFIEPIGNYNPKTISKINFFNKESLPKGNQVKQTFIVLK